MPATFRTTVSSFAALGVDVQRLLFDNSGNKKAAYTAVLDALNAAGPVTPTTPPQTGTSTTPPVTTSPTTRPAGSSCTGT